MSKERTIFSKFIKAERKKRGYTQKVFAMRSGLGLRFVRELEQGKETLRMDKVKQALSYFGYDFSIKRIGEDDE